MDARDSTGVLLPNESETLLIAGKAAGEQSGKLVLLVGEKSFTGKTRVARNHWQHVTITRDEQDVRVYLDGKVEPEIDAAIKASESSKTWLIGSDEDSTTTFDGKIDEVAVFDRALSAADIVDLYAKSGMTPPPRPKPTFVLGAKPSAARYRQAGSGERRRRISTISAWR